MSYMDPLVRLPLGRKSLTPGHGWRHLAGAVWERGNTRVHMNGMVRMPTGNWLSEKALWPQYQQVAWLVRINGGNRKRGLLAWGRLLTNGKTAVRREP